MKTRGLLLLCTLLTLYGCGFQLRGTSQADSNVKRLYIDSKDSFGVLAQVLRQRFQQSGTELTEYLVDAELGLKLSNERVSRRPVTTTAEISVAEYEIRLEVDVELVATDERVITLESTLYTERTYSFDESSLVGNSEEETLLMEEMRLELVDQILVRTNSSLRKLQGGNVRKGEAVDESLSR